MNRVVSKIKKAPKIFDMGVELTLAVGLLILIVIAVGIFLFSGRIQFNNSQGNNEITLQTNLPQTAGKVLDVEDSKTIKFGEFSITLSDEWNVFTIHQDYSQSEESECMLSDQKLCTVYLVRKGDQMYYISTPSALISKSSAVGNFIEKEFIINNVNYKFFYKKIDVFGIDDESQELVKDSEKIIYSEIYGCLKEGACVSSGLLNINDDNINKEEVRMFEDFLKSLKIN